MTKDTLPQVNDVIRSIRFVYGERDLFGRNNRITVGRDEPKCIVRRHLSDEEISEINLRTKKMPKGEALWIDEDLGSADLTRAKAEFVVIEARAQGGGPDPYGGVPYPDGWHVVAKRLDEGRKWNPDGEEIEFYMTGCFLNMIPARSVKIVGKLKMGFA